jgi:intracellular sulfur oxidation DsrE/DsrF family protein
MAQLKVLIHINELERWDTALGNIINLLKDVGEEAVDVVVLANGPSVNAYGSDKRLSVMKGLSEKGVRFLACKNSLRKMCSSGDSCITEEDLSSFIETVPAGITALIKIQSDGYAYVKP